MEPQTARPARSTRAFCVGQAKAGTASLCGLLASAGRAAHEPERADTLGMILREARDEASAAEVRDWLAARDRRLGLDYDIAWANQFLVDHLPEVFPDARFIVLVRDPYTWLVSVAGHLLVREIPPEVRGFLDWWFRPEAHPFEAGDAGLEARGLYSSAAFLAAWRRHVERCEAALPADRTLVLRTHELDRSRGRLEAFLGLEEGSLEPPAGRLNRGTWPGSLESLVDPDHLAATVARTCGEHVARLFPGVLGLEDAQALWVQTD